MRFYIAVDVVKDDDNAKKATRTEIAQSLQDRIDSELSSFDVERSADSRGGRDYPVYGCSVVAVADTPMRCGQAASMADRAKKRGHKLRDIVALVDGVGVVKL